MWFQPARSAVAVREHLSKNSDMPEQGYTEDELAYGRALVTEAVSALAPRTGHIMKLRLGLDGEEPQTLAEIAAEIGVSRERIRQIQEKAIRQLAARGRRRTIDGVEPAAKMLRSWLLDRIDFQRQEYVARTVNLGTAMFGPRALALGTLFMLRLAGIKKDDARKLLPPGLAANYGRLGVRDRPGTDFSWRIGQFIVWPEMPQVTNALPGRGRAREINEMSRGITGQFESTKLGRAVAYESRMELAFFLRLEAYANVVHYQEQPFAIKYVLNGIEHSYYPDVLFTLDDGRLVLAEIKTRSDFGQVRDLFKWAALWDFCRTFGYGLYIGDSRNSFQVYARRAFPAALETMVLADLQRGPIRWLRYQQLLALAGVKSAQPMPLILRHRLEWRLRPFELREPGMHTSRLDDLFASVLTRESNP